jgi:hypothetical protein
MPAPCRGYDAERPHSRLRWLTMRGPMSPASKHQVRSGTGRSRCLFRVPSRCAKHRDAVHSPQDPSLHWPKPRTRAGLKICVSKTCRTRAPFRSAPIAHMAVKPLMQLRLGPYHNPRVGGSNPSPATNQINDLAGRCRTGFATCPRGFAKSPDFHSSSSRSIAEVVARRSRTRALTDGGR